MLKAEIEWELLGNHALRVVNHAGVANLVTDVTVPRLLHFTTKTSDGLKGKHIETHNMNLPPPLVCSVIPPSSIELVRITIY